MSVPRSMVVWVPDWPIVAVTRDGDDPPDPYQPLMVVDKGAVVAASAAARAEGVRVGQRRRDAQARCPHVVVSAADSARDHRVYAPLLARIEERAPGVQVIAPGVCALQARGPARYYGGEAAAATVLSSILIDAGIDDVRVGVADGTFAAEQAARVGTTSGQPLRVIGEGAAAEFLAPLPVTVLDEDAADLFARLGVHTLGQVAGLGEERLVERFGARGSWLFARAAGHDTRPITPRTPPPDLEKVVDFEPALELAEQVAFGVRVAADEFIAAMGAIDLVCTELRVLIEGDLAERSERVWLHPAAFDASAVVDRVRWQLAEQRLSSGVRRVVLAPEAVDAAAHHAARLFGSGPEERVHHALSRVQAMLGHRAVLTTTLGGGRWLSERQNLVPWGDRAVAVRDRARPWPGSLPDPLPTTVFDRPVTIAVIDADGDMVAVDGRGHPTADPASIVMSGHSRAVVRWAGPWPVIEHGWDAARARHAHRFQILDNTQTAWLLVCEDGAWQIEGRYD